MKAVRLVVSVSEDCDGTCLCGVVLSSDFEEMLTWSVSKVRVTKSFTKPVVQHNIIVIFQTSQSVKDWSKKSETKKQNTVPVLKGWDVVTRGTEGTEGECVQRALPPFVERRGVVAFRENEDAEEMFNTVAVESEMASMSLQRTAGNNETSHDGVGSQPRM